MRPQRRARAATPARTFRYLCALLALVLVGLLGLWLAPGSPLAANAAQPVWLNPAGVTRSPPVAPTPSPTPPPLPPLPVRAANVKVNIDGWWSWSIMDQRTGKIVGSKNMAQVSTTASMIKAWIVADYLRRSAEKGQRPSQSRMDQLTVIVRDSANEETDEIFAAVGRSESIKRLITICKLTDSAPYKNYWSNTQLSARDTARMADCIDDGRAAGPKWTSWLINEMQAVRGAGDFGIRHAFPADDRPEIAIKNGWVDREEISETHVNCLAIGEDWTMGIMMQYPISLGYEYGMTRCKAIAAQLRAPTS